MLVSSRSEQYKCVYVFQNQSRSNLCPIVPSNVRVVDSVDTSTNPGQISKPGGIVHTKQTNELVSVIPSQTIQINLLLVRSHFFEVVSANHLQRQACVVEVLVISVAGRPSR